MKQLTLIIRVTIALIVLIVVYIFSKSDTKSLIIEGLTYNTFEE